MKKLSFLLLLFVNLSIAQNQEETIEWLNTNLDEYYSEGWGEQYEVKIVDDKNYGEMIVIEVFFQPLKTKTFYSFLPSAISRVSTTRKLRSDKVNGNLDLEFVSKNTRIWTKKEEFIDSFILSLQTSNENVEKIKRGFLHLFDLMGNKIEEQKDYFSN